jgi:hypothetical protein
VRHGLMRFMQAHGQTPGPGQRPRTAGALSGMGAGVLALPVLVWSGAGASLSTNLQLANWLILLLYVGIATAAGAAYGAVFRRAASDRRGGWLFGISYGFLLWMLGPVALLQTLLGHPLATGTGAMGVLWANLISGLVLGLCFRPAHGLVRAGLHRRTPARFPHTLRDRT